MYQLFCFEFNQYNQKTWLVTSVMQRSKHIVFETACGGSANNYKLFTISVQIHSLNRSYHNHVNDVYLVNIFDRMSHITCTSELSTPVMLMGATPRPHTPKRTTRNPNRKCTLRGISSDSICMLA